MLVLHASGSEIVVEDVAGLDPEPVSVASTAEIITGGPQR
jgi:hypothetical protein